MFPAFDPAKLLLENAAYFPGMTLTVSSNPSVQARDLPVYLPLLTISPNPSVQVVLRRLADPLLTATCCHRH